jgi:recombination protein RecA
MGVKLDIVEKSGAWFAYNGQKIGQGRDNARLFLKDNTEMRDEIDNKIRAAVFSDKPKESFNDNDIDKDLGDDEEDILGLEL